MAFSSFSEFSFMTSVDRKRLPRSGNFTFGNRKKSHEAISGEYGAWSMTWVEFLTEDLFACHIRKVGSVETWRIIPSAVFTNKKIYGDIFYARLSDDKFQVIFTQ